MRQFVFAFLFGLCAGCGETSFSSKAAEAASVKTDGEAVPLSEIAADPAIADDPQYDCSDSEGKKILVCHVPPGNPAARHTICIGAPALGAHLAHESIATDNDEKDTLGRCPGD